MKSSAEILAFGAGAAASIPHAQLEMLKAIAYQLAVYNERDAENSRRSEKRTDEMQRDFRGMLRQAGAMRGEKCSLMVYIAGEKQILICDTADPLEEVIRLSVDASGKLPGSAYDVHVAASGSETLIENLDEHCARDFADNVLLVRPVLSKVPA